MRFKEGKEQASAIMVNRVHGSAAISMPGDAQFLLHFFLFSLLTSFLSCIILNCMNMNNESDAQPGKSLTLYHQQNFQINMEPRASVQKANFNQEKWEGNEVCCFGEYVHFALGDHAIGDKILTTGGKRDEKKDRKIFYAGPVADCNQRLLH
ncbi:MAG: hypothetical protein GY950_21975, partial [bacterium]|nr:hypothetical protein [bacterium]